MEQQILWSPGMSLDALEKMVILKAFNFYRKNKTATAASLGIAIRTLDSKLERYEMEETVEKERQAELQRKRNEHLIKARGNPPNNIGVIYSPTDNVYRSAKDAASYALSRAIAGPRMESIANSSQEQEMPMPQREEIQTVLPKSPAKGGKDRGR